jgi:hypothetical protein
MRLHRIFQAVDSLDQLIEGFKKGVVFVGHWEASIKLNTPSPSLGTAFRRQVMVP